VQQLPCPFRLVEKRPAAGRALLVIGRILVAAAEPARPELGQLPAVGPFVAQPAQDPALPAAGQRLPGRLPLLRPFVAPRPAFLLVQLLVARPLLGQPRLQPRRLLRQLVLQLRQLRLRLLARLLVLDTPPLPLAPPPPARQPPARQLPVLAAPAPAAPAPAAPAPVPAATTAPAPVPSQPSSEASSEDVEMSGEEASNGSRKEYKQLAVGKADLVKGVTLSEANKYTIGELKEFLSLNFPEVDEQELKGKKKGALIDFVLAKLNS